MRGDLRGQGNRWVERALAVLGVVCLAYYGYQTTEAHNFRREQAAAFEALLDAAPVTDVTARPAAVSDSVRHALPDDERARSTHSSDRKESAGKVTTAPATPRLDGEHVMALLHIPRLDLSSVVLSGDGDDVLDVAVGHLPDTPKPWEPGNSALAAHRDGLFRPLRNIRVGDEIRVRSTHGELVYHVRETKVVAPDDLSVLAPTDTQTLTLITCYPFNYVGNAPKRFIVHADAAQ